MKTDHDPNCNYCTKSETLKAVMLELIELPASTVYLWKDGRHPGRCVVALKGHARELFALEPARRQQFMDDVSAVAAAIQQGFQADKINYAVFGDAVPHLHFHLVPKRKGGPEWGQPFVVNPSEPTPMSAEQTQSCFDILRTHLGCKESAAHGAGAARSSESAQR
jgi:diadenosine tetraphosphate (Ap4A) HIT family hydrolase